MVLKTFVKNITLIIIIISVLLLLTAIAANNVYASSNFNYTTTLNISGSTSDLINYPKMLTLYNTTGTNNGATGYLGSHILQSNWNDIRFYDTNGNLLDYKIEEYFSDHINVWVKISSIPTTGTQITLEYGNSSCLWYSSGSQTFTAYYQFDGQDILKRVNAISPTLPYEANGNYEPNVIYDTNPQIFMNSTNVFKMWYSAGAGGSPYPASINYAESLDGITWTKYTGNPLSLNGSGYTGGYMHSFAVKIGSIYYLYADRWAIGEGKDIDVFTSTDGVTFTIAKTSAVHVGSPGTWDDTLLGNTFVWNEGGNTWKMIYDAYGSLGGWVSGYATSIDGLTWTKYASNPILGAYMMGSPDVHKIGSTYYMWAHGNLTTYTSYPTDIYLYSSPDNINWTLVKPFKVVPRLTADEGATSFEGQTADPCLLEVNGITYVYYSAMPDQNHGTIKVAVANMPLSQFVNTNEGAPYDPTQFTNGYTGGTTVLNNGRLIVTGSLSAWQETYTTNNYTGALRACMQWSSNSNTHQIGWGTIENSANSMVLQYNGNVQIYTKLAGNKTTSIIINDFYSNSNIVEFERYNESAGIFNVNNTQVAYLTSNVSTIALPVYIAAYDTGNNISTNWISVRNITSPEPAASTWSTEEYTETHPSFTISASQTSVTESDTNILLTITKNRTTFGIYSVNLSTVDGTAASPGDFTAITNHKLTFDNATSTETVVLSIKDDTNSKFTDYPKTFSVILDPDSVTGNATVGNPYYVNITINADMSTATSNSSPFDGWAQYTAIIFGALVTLMLIGAIVVGAMYIRGALSQGGRQSTEGATRTEGRTYSNEELYNLGAFIIVLGVIVIIGVLLLTTFGNIRFT